MGRPLRFIPPGALVEVTTRTVQGRLLLRPSAEVNSLIIGIIGRAQSLFPVRIYALVVLSNHWHALVSAESAARLAAFMSFVNGNIAREIGRLHNWRDRFWARRYRSIVVADEAASVDRLTYILKHGCKEGLVDRPADWPGVSCVQALTEGTPLRGVWHDRTAQYRSNHKRGTSTGLFAEQQEVVLSPLPCWEDLTIEEYRETCAGIVSEIEAATQTERRQTRSRAMGSRAILAQRPHKIAVGPVLRAAPAVHALSAAVRRAYLEAFSVFVDAYRRAAETLRSRPNIDFPLGAFPPAGPFVTAEMARS